ncbi:MAG: serine/threonine protein kinase, partial [Chloroflexi bacterium]|nr:serine/threonine protein kinase [Chloroflexota bacterium]
MTDDLIGKQIGGYAILGLIGRGGMAAVYRAHQVSMNRSVAVKVLPRQFIDDLTYMQRFNREVQIAAQLEHRSIVPVHDYGESDGQPYIVMRYMAGGSVDDMLNAGPLRLDQIVQICAQIAPALDYAHGKSVLHRDLKPSNILLDDIGDAYLTDFGIARILGEAPGSTITTDGAVGTPSYMSPEQAQGHPLDHRTDIYALGVSLFEMATARRPFEGDTPYGVAVMHVTTPPPSPRLYNESIPVSVEQVILKALNKRREDRYDSAAALAAALRTAVEAPQASPPPDPQPSAPPPIEIQPLAERPIPAPVYPAPSAPSLRQVPPASVPKRKRRPFRLNLWVGAMIGGVLGCALLTVVVGIGLLIVGTSTSEVGPGETPTATADVTPSAHARALVNETAAAVESATPRTPTRRATAITNTPVERSGPSGTVIFFAQRPITVDGAPVEAYNLYSL